MMALEEAFQTTIDEARFATAKTIADLEAVVGSGSGVPGFRVPGSFQGSGSGSGSGSEGSRSSADAEPIAFPSWNRSGPAWLLRRVSLPTWILPLSRPFLDLTVEGLEHLARIEGPVVFAANHQSHMDVPAIFRALPARRRYRVAPAMAKEFFTPHFNRRDYGWKAWFTNSLNYYLAVQFFNAFPLPQREAGTRQTMRYIGEIANDGYSIIIFPEGRRLDDGIGEFRPGIGMIGSKLGLPVVPVRLEGLDKVLHPKMKWPKRGPVRVAFGAPMRLEGEDYVELARKVEQAVRAL